MNNIKQWFKTLERNDIHCNNKVSSRDLALCFNFLQIPDTNVIVMTMTVMKNQIKKISLTRDSFGKVMSVVEEALTDTFCDSIEEKLDPEIYYGDVRNLLNDSWYIQLCCHRVFFITEGGLWDTIENLFNNTNMQKFQFQGITEVSVYVNTQDYDCNAKFY